MRLIFGEYGLDGGTRQLFRADNEVRLSPKAFDLLQTLVSNRSRAVSKKELHDRLWPGTFVTDANLALLVTEVRRALGDDPKTPVFVRTVHRFGYAFCAQVTGEPAGSVSTFSCWVLMKDTEIRLGPGEHIIGRDPGAAVRLDFPSVSRRHARLSVSSTGASLEDLDSKNGTFLRERQIEGIAVLADCDDVRIGSVRLSVRLMTGGDVTATAAAI